MVLTYRLSVYRPIFSHISISCIVADITNSEFHTHIFNLLSCVGHVLVMCWSFSFEFTTI